MLKGSKVQTTLYLDAEVHRRLKATLAMREMTMTEWLDSVARRWIDGAAIVPMPENMKGTKQ